MQHVLACAGWILLGGWIGATTAWFVYAALGIKVETYGLPLLSQTYALEGRSLYNGEWSPWTLVKAFTHKEQAWEAYRECKWHDRRVTRCMTAQRRDVLTPR